MTKDPNNKEKENYAHKIYDSKPILTSILREHEQTLTVFHAAAGESLCPHADSVKSLENLIRDKIEYAKANLEKESEAIPQKDPDFIRRCQDQIRETERNKKAAAQKIQNDYDIAIQQNNKRRKSSGLMAVLGLVIFLLGIITASVGSDIWAIMFIVALILMVVGLGRLTKKPPLATKSQIENLIYKSNERFDRIIKSIEKDIEQGYKPYSEFHIQVLEKTLSLQQQNKVLVHCRFLSENGFQLGIRCLQETIENFDSITNWASSYVQDQAQLRHNQQMERIEQEKAYALQIASEKQTRLMEEQTKAAAELARATADQARATEEQARAAEEIRRRMENEHYGTWMKPLP